MALRDQPYLPLYVQDYLTDEKLNNCSAAAQGVYIKIMCVLHKQEEYGKLLIKLKDKLKSSNIENFALKLTKQLAFSDSEILNAITELVDEGVLIIDGDYLLQKRMVHDFSVSLKRAEAGKKGGGNPNLNKQSKRNLFKQKEKQNTEYVNEDENINEIKNEKKGIVKGKKQLIEFNDPNDPFHPLLNAWFKYKKEQHNFTYKSNVTILAVEKNLRDYSSNDPEIAKKIILDAIGNGYKGFFRLKGGNMPETKENRVEGIVNSTYGAMEKVLEQIKNKNTDGYTPMGTGAIPERIDG